MQITLKTRLLPYYVLCVPSVRFPKQRHQHIELNDMYCDSYDEGMFITQCNNRIFKIVYYYDFQEHLSSINNCHKSMRTL